MRVLAGSILILAAAVVLAGGLIAQALDKQDKIYTVLATGAAAGIGVLGLGTLAAGFFSDRRADAP